jgi:hypothetical protein
MDLISILAKEITRTMEDIIEEVETHHNNNEEEEVDLFADDNEEEEDNEDENSPRQETEFHDLTKHYETKLDVVTVLKYHFDLFKSIHHKETLNGRCDHMLRIIKCVCINIEWLQHDPFLHVVLNKLKETQPYIPNHNIRDYYACYNLIARYVYPEVHIG